ncbi:MAG: GntR family transcriptional regulator, partial [Rhodospirillaceae bacterium]|nr:GntR family transcriptional regulator [Rhodospirillaceae bacterium]
MLAWLRQRDLKPGDHVPERLATEAFHVSRTPVRAALALLTERGLLERR